jgi:hypothetical protein
MNCLSTLHPAVLDWLLDPTDPGPRYLALRDLVRLEPGDSKLIEARECAHREGPIATILDAIAPEGYWAQPGPGYNPKYRSTVWSLITLGQLGASIEADERIRTACDYLLDHALTEHGQFAAGGTPGSTVDCLQGNLLTALLDLGCEDERLEVAFEWMARTTTGEGIAPLGDPSTPLRYYAGKCGPGFQCGANNKLPCAWGAVKVMLAFSRLPLQNRTPLIERAIQTGIDFLLSIDPATAAYPTGYTARPSGNWWKFSFPVFYVTDLLQLAEALVGLGLREDPRLANTLQLVAGAQDKDGRWSLDYHYSGKTVVDFGEQRKPNKWVTLRAAIVLEKND